MGFIRCIREGKAAQIRLEEAWIMEIYARGKSRKSLSATDYQRATEIYDHLKEKSKSKESRVDIIWREMQTWTVFDRGVVMENDWHRKFKEFLASLTVITNGKQQYFEQDDGRWYSRISCKYLTTDEMIAEYLTEFKSLVE